jgi:hypothetical protein
MFSIGFSWVVGFEESTSMLLHHQSSFDRDALGIIYYSEILTYFVAE